MICAGLLHLQIIRRLSSESRKCQAMILLQARLLWSPETLQVFAHYCQGVLLFQRWRRQQGGRAARLPSKRKTARRREKKKNRVSRGGPEMKSAAEFHALCYSKRNHSEFVGFFTMDTVNMKSLRSKMRWLQSCYALEIHFIPILVI